MVLPVIVINPKLGRGYGEGMEGDAVIAAGGKCEVEGERSDREG